MKMPISLSVAGDKKKGVLAGFQNTIGVCVRVRSRVYRDSITGPLYKKLKIG